MFVAAPPPIVAQAKPCPPFTYTRPSDGACVLRPEVYRLLVKGLRGPL